MRFLARVLVAKVPSENNWRRGYRAESSGNARAEFAEFNRFLSRARQIVHDVAGDTHRRR